ncbi:MAG TPA: plastocyanin/azurin family copper-binding protein [Candidatus Udaeobacter sp.]|jgi:plastocyanin|nr:plastocyanin/azurin family copper-binding protein [Candidatus Udaeobacter sp.]
MATRFRWLRPAIVLTLGIASAIVVHSCSSKSNPTNPGGGGGGGAELNSGNISNGTTFSHTFNTAGSFPYHCTIHSGMTGTIVVNSGGSTTDTTFMMQTGVPYPTVTAKVGATIHWSNNSGTTHTVTSG